ncbi:MAG: hypothetical protein NZM03_08980 [Limisphaera sp.]|nr:hypothetical protein [Limisphaera sp.]
MSIRTWKATWAAGGVGMLLGLALPNGRATQELFLNTGVLQATFPPEPLPAIDAYRVLNLGTIGLTNLALLQPIEFQNMLYITNRGRWWGYPGYRFQSFNPISNPQRRPASVFHNEGLVNPNGAEVSSALWLLVQATNIINRGRLEISSLGQLNLTGDNVDLRGGEVRFQEAGDTNLSTRTYDLHWGFDTNQILGRFGANQPPLQSPLHQVRQLTGLSLSQVVLPVGFTSHVLTTQLPNNSLLIQAVYVYNGGEISQAEVRMTPWFNVIRWQGVFSNLVTLERTTNDLYLMEFLTPNNYIFNLTNGTLYASSLSPRGASRPFNFWLSGVQPSFYSTMPVVGGTTFDSNSWFYTIGTNLVLDITNSGYRTRIIPAAMVPSETQPGSVFSNVAGRVELVARQILDLRDARISAPSYLRLEATNHLADNAQAQIEAPYSAVRLGSTNGLLQIRHLQFPRIPRIVGDLHAWVGMWTNITSDGVGLIYKVLMVSNYFLPSAETRIEDLVLSSPRQPREVRIADKLNVFGSLLIDAERLTLTTNPPVAYIQPPWSVPPFNPYGELNLMTNRITWADSLPRLRYLTNYGVIAISNVATFAGIRRPPYYPSVFQEPYEAVVNQGWLTAQAWDIQARHFENEGHIVATVGSFRLSATEVRLGSRATNQWGQVAAPFGDVELQGSRLLLTNQVVEAGRRLILGASEFLGDGDTTNNVWLTRDGLTLTLRPRLGDLRGTTITNIAPAYAYNVTLWAGEDRGPTPSGFTNNMAIGRLVLDGAFGAMFVFQGVGPSNALYVDQLVLLNHATNEHNNALVALNIAPNLVIYYADLIVGTHRLAEIAHSSRYNNGRLRWVPTYAGGYYGSTNLQVGARQLQVNTALVLSKELDLDGDGTPNALDTIPILVPEDVRLSASPDGTQWIVLAWPSIRGATNTIWEATSLTTQDWRVVLTTNFSVLPLPPGESCTNPPCLLNQLPGRGAVRLPAAPQGVRFYRVQVEPPLP